MDWVEDLVRSRKERAAEDASHSQHSFPYASHYCEENVYKLLSVLVEHRKYRACAEQIELYAVFISTVEKTTPIWCQKLGDPVVWDYHVVACVKIGSQSIILDFDTNLPFSIQAESYVAQSLRPDITLKPQFQQLLRIVNAERFLSHFASDRSHMATSGLPPPPWACIRGEAASSAMNLMDFVSMDSAPRDDVLGTVQRVKSFMHWLREAAVAENAKEKETAEKTRSC